VKASLFLTMPYLAKTGSLPSGWPTPPGRFDPELGVQSINASLDLAQEADELGFDWVSIAEHHYQPRLQANPLVIAGALSQRVKRAKVAILGSTIPMLNPVRVAEELALVDNLLGGRLVSMLLRGIATEFQTYGVTPDESRPLFEEGAELILRAWTEPEPFGWQGRHFQYRTVAVWPRPVQLPHPPVFMSGKAPESAQFAAKHHLSIGLSFNPVDECKDAVEYYRSLAVEAGWEPTQDNMLYRAQCYVADTDEQAREESTRYGFGRQRTATPAGPRARGGKSDAELFAERMEVYAGHGGQLATIEKPRIFEGRIFRGSPETVFQQIKYLHDEVGMGIVDLMFNDNEGGGMTLPHELQERSLHLFATEVLPRLRDI
jgi:alkanesulfonate monooxygenase SsuD/methylene tetrahydromethanopterin reductase-like flavin-dependent oxidoreductase (luciferase family)